MESENRPYPLPLSPFSRANSTLALGAYGHFLSIPFPNMATSLLNLRKRKGPFPEVFRLPPVWGFPVQRCVEQRRPKRRKLQRNWRQCWAAGFHWLIETAAEKWCRSHCVIIFLCSIQKNRLSKFITLTPEGSQSLKLGRFFVTLNCSFQGYSVVETRACDKQQQSRRHMDRYLPTKDSRKAKFTCSASKIITFMEYVDHFGNNNGMQHSWKVILHGFYNDICFDCNKTHSFDLLYMEGCSNVFKQSWQMPYTGKEYSFM